MIIVPLKEAPPLTHELTQEFFALSGQPSGWITATIFREWATKVDNFMPMFADNLQIMIPWVIKKRNSNLLLKDKRALLYLDGHLSHEDPDAIQALSDNQIDVYVLYPHSNLSIYQSSILGESTSGRFV